MHVQGLQYRLHGADEARGVVSKHNTFERPLDQQRKDFEERLAAVLSQRKPKPP